MPAIDAPIHRLYEFAIRWPRGGSGASGTRSHAAVRRPPRAGAE